MTIKFAVDYFLGGLNNRFGNLRINGAKAFIYLSRSLFDLSKRANKLARKAQVADRKIEYGTVGICAPLIVILLVECTVYGDIIPPYQYALYLIVTIL